MSYTYDGRKELGVFEEAKLQEFILSFADRDASGAVQVGNRAALEIGIVRQASAPVSHVVDASDGSRMIAPRI
jgi:hypothetical protein